MSNNNNIAVFDFETSSANTTKAQVLSIGCVILDSDNLKQKDEFYSLCKYEDWSTVEPKALSINKLTKDMLDKAPDIKIVFGDFVSFLNKYKVGNSIWNACIPSGFNIAGFDIPILDRYCQKFGYYNKKDDKNTLFRPFPVLDVATLLFSWFENEKEPAQLNLSACASYLGFSKENLDNAHNSLQDSKLTASILVRFLKFQRNLMEKYRTKIKGCFNE